MVLAIGFQILKIKNKYENFQKKKNYFSHFRF